MGASVLWLLSALVLAAPQQDETVRDFKKFFRKAKDPAERAEHVYALDGIDDPSVAKVLIPVLTDDEPMVAAAALDVVSKLPSERARMPFLVIFEKGKPKELLPIVVRAAGAGGWTEFTLPIRELLGSGDDETRLWSVVACAQLGDLEALPILAGMTNSDKLPLVRVALVDALAALGKGHEEVAGPPLVLALDDAELAVQTAACLALRRIRVREAIPVLIRLMEGAEGRIHEHLYPTLLELTDLPFRDDPAQWRGWWERAQGDYQLLSDAEVAKRRAARNQTNLEYRPERKAASFLGVDTPSLRVIFVIDVSGSMEEEVVDRELFRERGFVQFGKLDIVREELLRTIEGLEGHVRFNILAFASEVEQWRNDLAPANALNQRSAIDFVRDLEAIGGTASGDLANAGLVGSSGLAKGRTNTYAALCAALGVSEAEALGTATESARGVKSAVDTIFFLSDGRPSVGELVDPDDILVAVNRLNQFRRVTIHTIAIGEFQKDFMYDLAHKNGGVFVDLGR
ncbi:MAG: VWA domain-containing protein [Planctomycetes bacterium]|nr:VWA domain-containing protein [Planctomycetota bacterium]